MIHVEGSGTGVKLIRRFVPEVERLNAPPLNGDVNADVFRLIAARFNPTKLVADAMAQE